MDQNPNLPPEQPTPLTPEPQLSEGSKRKRPWGAILGTLYIASLVAALVVAFVTPKAPEAMPAQKKSAKGFPFFESKSEAIGIVRLEGLISMERRGGLFGETAVDRVRKNLERLAKKKNVKAVILRINSPGGTVASSQEIYASINDVRAKYKKPVIALMGDVAASGGYYAAAACDRIVAEPGTLTGSIGVIFQTGQFHELFKRWGIAFNTIKSGPYKDIGNFTRPMTTEERQILQNLIDTAYDQFVQAVAKGRNMPAADVRALADGRIWIASQARTIGLIDEDSGMLGALNLAKYLGKIKGEPKLIWDWDLREDLFSELLALDEQSSLLRRLEINASAFPTGLLYLWPGGM